MNSKIDRNKNKTAKLPGDCISELPGDCDIPHGETREWLHCPECGSERIRLMSATYGNTYVRCVGCGNEGAPEKFLPRRRTYAVRWEIEVDACSALEAAKEAETIQRIQANREDEEGRPVKAGVFDVRLFPQPAREEGEAAMSMRVDLDTETVNKRIELYAKFTC